MESLRDQVAYLREILATREEEIRRRDVIISQLTQRIPEIEAPEDASQSAEPQSSTPTSTEATAEAQEPAESQSWWQRWFGG